MSDKLRTLTPKWVLLLLALLLIGGLAMAAVWWSGEHLFTDGSQTKRGLGLEIVSSPGDPIGQTFVAYHAGLCGIEVWLEPAGDSTPVLTLHLRTDPDSGADLATSVVQLTPGSGPGYVRFPIPVRHDSHGQYYYAFIETTGTGERQGIVVPLADGGSYQDGAAYQGHTPLDAQTAFRLIYQSQSIVLDLIKTGLQWPGLLLIIGLLFVIPGWALLAWLWPQDSLTWPETLGLAAGLSLAFYPLLMLWTRAVGLALGALYAWLPPILGLLALGIRYRSWRPRHGWSRVQRWAHSEAIWPDLALLLTLGLVFAVRMLVVGTIRVPMWGDSYQHTMVSQLMADHGGLFDSWEPYVPLKSFTYHYGFQASVTLYHWLTGAEMVRSTIVVGQIVNTLAVLVLVPLASKLSGNRWAGVVAVLVAGLLSPMPAYYVNWGRYVQLAGQVILPVAVWLVWSSLELPERHLGADLLAAGAGAGLVLTHYRIALYLAAFLPIVWLATILVARRQRTSLREPSLRLLRTLLVMALLIAPWVRHLFAGLLISILGAMAQSTADVSNYAQAELLSETTRYLPVGLLAAGLLGLATGLLRRQWQVALLAAWVGILLIAANPNWIGLPGAVTVSNFEGVLNNFTLIISLYMPVSLLCGHLFSSLFDWWPSRRPLLRQGLALALVLALAISGVPKSLKIIESRYALVTEPDMRAMAWIESHTPEHARFLANSFFAYADHIIVGSDAGWWLPLLAHRQNTVPPITYGHEAAHTPDYIEQVNEFARFVDELPLDAPETIQRLKNEQVTHVYIGQKGGSLQVAELLHSDAFEPIYHKDRVWIFQIH